MEKKLKICVLNGSPKGNNSVTLQTVLFLEKKFSNCTFEILNISQKIKYYEKKFDELEESISSSDVLLFAYPVYTFLAPSQLHKFISLLKERNLDLTTKFATQITTSKHFYDISAHNYIEDNCHDLGLKVIKGLSADMDDLTKSSGQNDAVLFMNYVCDCVENDRYELSNKIVSNVKTYERSFKSVVKKDKYKTLILTDVTDEETGVLNMIEDFKAIYPYETQTINIREYPFTGGCLGCFKCSINGHCMYKDGFEDFLRNQIQTADSIIYAFSIKDHSMGHIFKCYDDRQFCNGHRFMTVGMPIGYLVHGNIDLETNLKFVIESRAEVGHNFLSGIAVDNVSLKLMVSKLLYSLDNKYYLPQNFYGVGGRKIFRDLIFVMRGLMKEDHKFYKKTGVYDDLPQRSKGKMVFISLFGLVLTNKKLKKKMENKMNEYILMPYKKVIEKA